MIEPAIVAAIQSTGPFLSSTASAFIANVMAESCKRLMDKHFKSGAILEWSLVDVDQLDIEINRYLRFFPTLFSTDSTVEIRRVEKFLRSYEFAELVRNCVAHSTLSRQSALTSSVQLQLRLALEYHGLDAAKCLRIAPFISRALIDMSRQHLAANSPTSDAHRRIREAALETFREMHAVRVDEHLSVLRDLVDQEHIDTLRMERKLDSLRAAVIRIHGGVSHASIDDNQQFDSDSLYVPPTVQVSTSKPQAAPIRIAGRDVNYTRATKTTTHFEMPRDIASLLTLTPRTVVLGPPGAGKTTLLSQLSRKISSGQVDDGPRVAVPIILREHVDSLSDQQSSGIDLVEALLTTCSKRYQVHLSRTEARFLASTGRLLMVVDGLDEMLTVGRRKSVSESINSFAAVHPDCPMLISSRLVGYTQAPLDAEMFETSEIMPFDVSQVSTYVNNWFAAASANDEDAAILAADLIEESDSVADLRENPLLLSLMCSLYKHQRYLPRNRPAVYAACARLLFDLWDRRRRLRPSFDFDAHVDGAVQHLAGWIFDAQERHAGVAEPELIEVAAEFFVTWQYGDVRTEEALQAAREFINFCKGRAWILSDTGKNAAGVALFQFTHRTFLEYFTALNLAQSLTDQEIMDTVCVKAMQSSWSMVCQILIQLASKKRRGLEDEIALKLVSLLPSLQPDERGLAITVLLQSLSSSPFKPGTVRAVMESSLTQFMTRLYRAPSARGANLAATRERATYWVNGAQIAAENHLVAGDVVREKVANSVRDEVTLLKASSHLVDYFFIGGSTPRGLSGILASRWTQKLGHLATVKASEPWVAATAIILGAPVTGATQTYLYGDGSSDSLGVASIRAPWSNRLLPSGLELCVWIAIHATEQSEIDHAQLTGKFALDSLALYGRPSSFDPHWLWFEDGDVRAPQSRRVGLDLLRVSLPCVLTLCEVWLEGVMSEPDRLAARLRWLTSRNWGALGMVSGMVSERYNLNEKPLADLDRRTLHALGYEGWLTNPDVTALSLGRV